MEIQEEIALELAVIRHATELTCALANTRDGVAALNDTTWSAVMGRVSDGAERIDELVVQLKEREAPTLAATG